MLPIDWGHRLNTLKSRQSNLQIWLVSFSHGRRIGVEPSQSGGIGRGRGETGGGGRGGEGLVGVSHPLQGGGVLGGCVGRVWGGVLWGICCSCCCVVGGRGVGATELAGRVLGGGGGGLVSGEGGGRGVGSWGDWRGCSRRSQETLDLRSYLRPSEGRRAPQGVIEIVQGVRGSRGGLILTQEAGEVEGGIWGGSGGGANLWATEVEVGRCLQTGQRHTRAVNIRGRGDRVAAVEERLEQRLVGGGGCAGYGVGRGVTRGGGRGWGEGGVCPPTQQVTHTLQTTQTAGEFAAITLCLMVMWCWLFLLHGVSAATAG